MAEMRIAAIAPWAGSKRNLAPRIVEECGPTKAWWELCCGSLSVTARMPRASMETVVDMNGDLVNLALVIQDDELCERMENRLHRTWMSDDIFRASAHVVRDDVWSFESAPDWERAYHYFVFCWMGRNGDSGTTKVGYSFCRRYTKNGGHAATRFKGAVESLSAFNERLRNVTILRDDIFTVLPRIEDAAGVTIYIDPPYVEKGLRYVHDFADSDHERLAEQLQRFKKTRVIVSYYEHPLLAKLYSGWTKRTFDVSKALASSGRRDRSNDIRATEVLLINGPSLVEKPVAASLFT